MIETLGDLNIQVFKLQINKTWFHMHTSKRINRWLIFHWKIITIRQDLPDFLITTMPSKEVIQQSMADILTCCKWNIILAWGFLFLAMLYCRCWVESQKWRISMIQTKETVNFANCVSVQIWQLKTNFKSHNVQLPLILFDYKQYWFFWLTCFPIHLKHEDFYNCQFLMADALASFLLMKRHSILYSFQSTRQTMLDQYMQIIGQCTLNIK